MAFSPIDLPIQEMLQTDFITDLSTIHNSNVLILKDQFESLINNLEIDVNNRTIGTDNAIASVKANSLIMQDDGFIFQKSPLNTVIAKLFKNGLEESVLNIDHIEMQNAASVISTKNINTDTLTVSDSLTASSALSVGEALTLGGSLVESKETVSILFEKNGVAAEGTLTLTDTSKNNIYVTIDSETAAGGTQVYNGSALVAGISTFNLIVDFDATNPPAQNTTFTIHFVDVIENNFSNSITTVLNGGAVPVAIVAGTNQSTTNSIILHSSTATLSTSTTGTGINSVTPYNANATLNYIIDANLNDRLMIKSVIGLDIY